MLCYRVIRAVIHGYPLVVLWLYVAALLLALMLMFVFPPGTILLLWLGLVGLVLVIVVSRLLAVVQHVAARWILGSGSCPSCGRRMETRRDDTTSWRCEACRCVFMPSGAERELA